MNNSSGELKGILFVIACGLCYGLLGYFGTTILKAGFSTYNMLFWRFFVATCVIGIFAFFELKKSGFFKKNLKSIKKVFLASAIFHSGAAFLYFTSSKYVGTGLAMVLFFIYPVVVMVLNIIFYKISLSNSYFIALAAILGGIILIADFANFSGNFIGILIGISAALCYGSYVFSVQKSPLKPIALAFFVTFGCSSSLILIALFDGSFVIPQTGELFSNILGIGIICAALPILFFLSALKYIPGEKAAMLEVSEPLSVLFFGYILLGERISLMQFYGVLLILAGAVIAGMAKSVKNRNVAGNLI